MAVLHIFTFFSGFLASIKNFKYFQKILIHLKIIFLLIFEYSKVKWNSKMTKKKDIHKWICSIENAKCLFKHFENVLNTSTILIDNYSQKMMMMMSYKSYRMHVVVARFSSYTVRPVAHGFLFIYLFYSFINNISSLSFLYFSFLK